MFLISSENKLKETSTFQKKNVPADIEEFNLAGKNIVDCLVESKLASSRSEARRLLEQGSIEINGQVIESFEEAVPKDSVIQKGKRYFVKVV